MIPSLPHQSTDLPICDRWVSFSRITPPRRARPPGTEIVYSNWGMSVVGHLVEVASGQSFHDYVEANIFHPLRMERSTFRNPVPRGLRPSIATAGMAGQPMGKTAVQLFPS